MCDGEDVSASWPVSPYLEYHADCFYSALHFSQVLEGLSTNVFQQVQDRQYTFALSLFSDVPLRHTLIAGFYLRDVTKNSTCRGLG